MATPPRKPRPFPLSWCRVCLSPGHKDIECPQRCETCFRPKDAHTEVGCPVAATSNWKPLWEKLPPPQRRAVMLDVIRNLFGNAGSQLGKRDFDGEDNADDDVTRRRAPSCTVPTPVVFPGQVFPGDILNAEDSIHRLEEATTACLLDQNDLD